MVLKWEESSSLQIVGDLLNTTRPPLCSPAALKITEFQWTEDLTDVKQSSILRKPNVEKTKDPKSQYNETFSLKKLLRIST